MEFACVATPTTEQAAPVQQAAVAVPEGWELVPIEPTPEMIGAMAVCDASGQRNGVPTVGMAGAEEVYAAMLAASPTPPAGGSSDHLAACDGDVEMLPTPPAQRWQVGTWTLTAPDGRTWQADSPLKACSAEQRDRIPPEVALKRIFDALDEGAQT
jgi:hypothetical protein